MTLTKTNFLVGMVIANWASFMFLGWKFGELYSRMKKTERLIVKLYLCRASGNGKASAKDVFAGAI